MTDPNAPAAYPAGYAAPAQPGADYPGKTMGIVGLILAFVFSLAGLIVSIIANNQSKQAGFKNGPAKAGIIISIILMVIGVIVSVIMVIFYAAIFAQAGLRF